MGIYPKSHLSLLSLPAFAPYHRGVLGSEVELDVERVAHGGHFVGRMPGEQGERGQVVFIRHALPGERVRVRITEVGSSFLRGDAVEVLVASPDRVDPACPLAHPDGCGGCDFQHVSAAAQRELKAAVVAEQLARLAGVERTVTVEEVPPVLRWRTRMQYVPLPGGGKGLRKHRSHVVVEVDDCLIAAPDAREPGDGVVTESVLGHDFRVSSDGFWQVHPEAPRVLTQTVLAMLDPRPGEHTLDLYAGVGLFSAFLAEAVGASGQVVAVEGDRTACRFAAENLDRFGWAEVRCAPVSRALDAPDNDDAQADTHVDVVVLDPPRSGAKRDVVEKIAALGPRAVAYVACDPAALARDLQYFSASGYHLADLRAFDLFPMTHHVECVALIEPVTAAPSIRRE